MNFMSKFLQRRPALSIFLFFFSLYAFFMGGHGYGGVGTSAYAVTRSIVLERSVAISQTPWGKFGSDGQFYAQYGIGHSLYNIPFYLIGHWLTALSPALQAQYNRITMFATLLGQPFVSALSCVLLFVFCQRLRYSYRHSLYCTFLYGLGTQAWMYAQLDFSEPILTFFLLQATYWLYVAEKSSDRATYSACFLCGLFLGIATSVKIVGAIVWRLFFGYLLSLASSKHISRWKMMASFSLPLMVFGIGMIGCYNFYRFGTPFETGYGNEFTSYVPDILRHFEENLIGLEGSIFLYSPVILLLFSGIARFYKEFTHFTLFILGIILTFFLFYPFTTNELYYGPRYLLPILPYFLIIGAASFANRNSFRKSPIIPLGTAVIIVLYIIGILQQLLGVLVNYHTYYWRIQYTMPIAAEALRSSAIGAKLLATPNLPHILGHLWLLKEAWLDLFAPGGLPLVGVNLLSDVTRQNSWIPYYGIDVWWCHPKFVAIGGVIFPLMVCIAAGSVLSFALYGLMRHKKVL